MDYGRADEALIKLTNVSMGYRSDRQPALSDVSLEIFPGDQIAVIGPNGAGKSTFLKTIVGLLPPLSGSLHYHGNRESTHKDCVSYIPQHEEIDWNYPITVREVVMMGRYGSLSLLQSPSQKDIRITDEAMERMQITAIADRKICDCSGGQQQRMFLARSLAQQPHIVLMDEPFNAVDLATERIILENLRHFHDSGVTALITTHDHGLASSQFEKVMLLNKKLIAFGSAAEVMTAKNMEKAYESYSFVRR